MEEKAILVMWDYSAYPLWSADSMQANLSPGRLALSDALRSGLNEWAADMEGLMAPGARQKPKWEPDPQELAELNRRLTAAVRSMQPERSRH